ncbi:MAG: diaminopimelate decarboxylase [Bdellovibrionales bacterium]|nr:diaminopimelate decarboxylase [Bdellovibrionales bacterium]
MSFVFENNQLVIKHENYTFELKSLANKTPVFVYDLNEVENRIRAIQEAFDHQVDIHYAVKANYNDFILKQIAQLGCGVDVVSLGEIDAATLNGVSAKNIVFSGVAKSVAEIKKSVETGIKQINVESLQELERIGEICKGMNRVANVSIRFNPDVDADTHPYIKTGFRENKFGMDQSFLPDIFKVLEKYKGFVKMIGLSIHIGSQLQDLKPYTEAILKSIPVYKQFQEKGYEMKTFNVGGGLGIAYDSINKQRDYLLIREFGMIVKDLLKDLNTRIIVEPGRILTGAAGILLTEIQYIKQTPYKNFAIVNTGMHHLLRPALYQAKHMIEPLIQKAGSNKETYDIVGPICESADTLGEQVYIQELKQGDILCIMDAGAYGYSMSSDYNLQPKAREVIVYDGETIEAKH